MILLEYVICSASYLSLYVKRTVLDGEPSPACTHITICFTNQDNKMFYLYSCVYPIHRKEGTQMYRRIRDMREDADLLQKDIANYLQCTQVSYSHYELGKRDIPTDVLIKLASFYKTSTDYLLGLTDIKEPYPKTKI